MNTYKFEIRVAILITSIFTMLFGYFQWIQMPRPIPISECWQAHTELTIQRMVSNGVQEHLKQRTLEYLKSRQRVFDQNEMKKNIENTTVTIESLYSQGNSTTEDSLKCGATARLLSTKTTGEKIRSTSSFVFYIYKAGKNDYVYSIPSKLSEDLVDYSQVE